MSESQSGARQRQLILLLFLVLMIVPMVGGAGEFKISRYIEPNQMSNLFTRHVRKKIIKRIGLTKDQMREVGEMMEEVRQASENRIADFSARLAAGELLGLQPTAPEPSSLKSPDRVIGL